MFGLGMNDMIVNGQHKSILKLYTLPYIDRKTCQEMYTDGFENYVTKDKFCTGYKLGKKKLIILITLMGILWNGVGAQLCNIFSK